MKKPEWVLELEYKHGLPIEQVPGHVYVLHYDAPRVVKSVSGEYPHTRSPSGAFDSEPITHYVGWTQQANPRKRVGKHGLGATAAIAYLAPGTMTDETELKKNGTCPKCDASLVPGC